MQEPWASVVRAILRTYVVLGTTLGIIAYGHFHFRGPPAALEACLAAHGIDVSYLEPAQIAYAGYKAAAWPVSLGWTLAEGEVTGLDWVFARYDPFAGACASE